MHRSSCEKGKTNSRFQFRTEKFKVQRKTSFYEKIKSVLHFSVPQILM